MRCGEAEHETDCLSVLCHFAAACLSTRRLHSREFQMSDKKSENSPLLQPNRSNTGSYENARAAYNNIDPEFSREIHDGRTPEDLNEECHQEGGGFLKSIIFGGLDGILTIFAIIAGKKQIYTVIRN